MWVWLLAVVILATTWLGGFIATAFGVRIPLWLQLGITLVVVLMVGLWLLYRRYRASDAAKQLRSELLKESSNANVLPAQRAGMDALRRQFEQAVESLKARGNGSGSGAQALYTLPWYVIIGPPGAGKTTALRHSGLDFPSMGSGLRGAGGTRNCDWWFSSEAILLDTAGRWAVQSDDHEEWLSFLRLVRRFRSKKPLNGLIVAVAVDQLLQSSEEQIEDLAKKLRSRVDEVITELRMVLPVYLMLTKTDLLGGFVEFFAEMRLSERQQVLGASMNIGRDGKTAQTTQGEFDMLMRSMERRMVQRLGGERHLPTRQRIYEFPLEFAQLREPLAQLVEVLFQKNPFQESPTFRGFYFTSGTQEGRPLDRVISGMAQAFGLVARAVTGPPPEPKSYFVSDMFRRVMFPDRNMASRTAGELRRQRLMRIGVALASLVIAVLILFPGAVSFAANLKWIRAVSDDVERAQEIKWRDGEPLNSKFTKLDPLKDDLKQVRVWERDGFPGHMGWGMYAGSTLEPALVTSYEAAMTAGFREPAQSYMEQRLAALTEGGIELTRYSEAYDLLKLYLMTSMADRLDVEWASPRLQKVWEQAYAERAGGSVELMSDHLALYLALVKEGRVRAWEADQALVVRARQVLATVPVLDRIFELIVKPANEQYQPLAHSEIFYGSVAPFVKSKNGVKVPGAFSRRGWASVQAQLEELEKTLEAESWVLGTATHKREDVEARIQALRAKYFATYLAAWRGFFFDLDVVEPGTSRQALKQVKALNEPRYPYERLLATVRERGLLDELKGDTTDPRLEKLGKSVTQKVSPKAKKALAVADAVADKLEKDEPKELTELRTFFMPLMGFLGQEEIGNRAASSGLERYQAILRRLSASLGDPEVGKTPAANKELVLELEQARREAATLLEALDAPTQQILKPLLMNPLAYHGVDPKQEPEPKEPAPESAPPIAAEDGADGSDGGASPRIHGGLAATFLALLGLGLLSLGRARPTGVPLVPAVSPGSIS
jgi:type VI secretion system protein ImpL